MSDLVYYGVWINWSRGKIYGSTMTLSQRDAGILIAFLAMFVSAAGAALWRILAFVIHQSRSGKAPRDGLHHQQQVILRDAATPGGASWQLIRLIPSWWKLADRPFWRSIALILLAALNLTAFLVAGILVAEVTKSAGTEVLVRSDNCGNWTVDNIEVIDAQVLKVLNDTVTAASYARSCYGGETSALQCQQFSKQSLPYTKSNGSCPFAEGMCLKNYAVLVIDTGNLSSHYDFGINSQQKDRISYRRRTTCAPIMDKGFYTTFNYTDAVNASLGDFDGQPGDVLDFYNFGPGSSLDEPSNFTYYYNRRAASVGYAYDLQSFEYNSGDGPNNTWIPDEVLIRNDSDISLMFLSANNIVYYGEVLDPIFQATTDIKSVNDNGKNVTLYSSDYFVNPLACIDQHQFCNSANHQCTKLDSYSAAVRAAQTSLQLNPFQYVIVSVFSIDLWLSTISNIIGGRGSSALRAQEVLQGLFSTPLPSNQWQIEVEYWFTSGLARMQQYIVQYASGPTNVVSGAHVNKPNDNDTVSRQLCNSQKIRIPNGSGATCFSTLGVAIIIALGGLLILTQLALDTVVSTIKPHRSYRLMRWALDEKLQLQRLAYEQAGMGTWTGGTQSVPVTKRKETFGLPKDLDRVHPTFSNGDKRQDSMHKGGFNEESVGERTPTTAYSRIMDHDSEAERNTAYTAA